MKTAIVILDSNDMFDIAIYEGDQSEFNDKLNKIKSLCDELNYRCVTTQTGHVDDMIKDLEKELKGEKW